MPAREKDEEEKEVGGVRMILPQRAHASGTERNVYTRKPLSTGVLSPNQENEISRANSFISVVD